MKSRMVTLTLTIVTDQDYSNLQAAADNLKGRSLPGLEGSLIWVATLAATPSATRVESATRLTPIPGLVKPGAFHPVECDCEDCTTHED